MNLFRIKRKKKKNTIFSIYHILFSFLPPENRNKIKSKDYLFIYLLNKQFFFYFLCVYCRPSIVVSNFGIGNSPFHRLKNFKFDFISFFFFLHQFYPKKTAHIRKSTRDCAGERKKKKY